MRDSVGAGESDFLPPNVTTGPKRESAREARKEKVAAKAAPPSAPRRHFKPKKKAPKTSSGSNVEESVGKQEE